MWKLSRPPETKLLTPNLAKKFSEMAPCPGDRAIRESRMAYYRKVVEENKFGPVTWARALVEETGKIYRVNGKHTSTLFSSLDGEFPIVYVTIQSYTCDTMEDLANLYAIFDSKYQTRNSGDIYMTFASTVPELAELSRRDVCRATSGIAYFHWREQRNVHKSLEMAELLLKYPDFILWLQNLLSGNEGRILDRAPAIAAILATYLKSKSDAEEFWTRVRDQTGATPDTPDRKLAIYLMRSSLGIRGVTLRSRVVTSREMYVKCLLAWNNYRKGTKTNLNYHPDGKIPRAL